MCQDSDTMSLVQNVVKKGMTIVVTTLLCITMALNIASPVLFTSFPSITLPPKRK